MFDHNKNKTVISPNCHFSILAAFLSTQKSVKHITNLKQFILSNNVNWEAILYLSNINMCTPLWYAQLHNDSLLKFLPDELVQYLQNIYELNRIRNQSLRKGLKEILKIFSENGVESILLKGAATFCDDLYESGARIMGDLDILIPAEKVLFAQNLLINSGYILLHKKKAKDNGFPVNEGAHHMPELTKPGTPIVVELHYNKIFNGIYGSYITTEQLWSNRVICHYKGYKTSIFNPQMRITHQIMHALFPDHEYLSAEISMAHMSEFSFLSNKYNKQINWHQFNDFSNQYGLNKEFGFYLEMSKKYFGSRTEQFFHYPQWHFVYSEKRLILTSKNDTGFVKKMSLDYLLIILFKLRYYLGMINWLWCKKCYNSNTNSHIKRINYCLTVFLKWAWYERCDNENISSFSGKLKFCLEKLYSKLFK